MKKGGVSDTAKGQNAFQEDLNSLEKWAVRNLMKFNKEVQSSAPGEEQYHEPVQAGDHPSWKQLCREGLGGSGGNQVEPEPSIYPYGKEDE